MGAHLTFLGAAQGVTGSRYVLECAGRRLLIDCGLYQERDLRARNWDPFPTPPATIDAVLLTHAHLDHCGLLPKLVREGFNGPIFCTAATAEIADIVLLDSANIQEEDAEFKRRRHERENRTGPFPPASLYTPDDAKAASRRLSPVDYGRTVNLGAGVAATFRDAGHILGSANIHVSFPEENGAGTIVFSGDIGRWNAPILRDPVVVEEADHVVMESTYGDRVHEDITRSEDLLADVINATRKKGGNVLIPSFAIERAQEVLYHLNALLLARRIPPLTVFLDSPMAVGVTRVMERHHDLLDAETREFYRRNHPPFAFPNLTMTESTEASKAINRRRDTSIIIAGSGMCTGGRVKHHLVHNISRPESAVVFVGYQAVGTLGRQIVDGARQVRILGQSHPVRARVLQLHGFSSHADRNELIRWISGLARPPRRVFVTHGESEVARSFAATVTETLGYPTAVPAYGDQASLE
jgi:metallo-beta-lactamase family protein